MPVCRAVVRLCSECLTKTLPQRQPSLKYRPTTEPSLPPPLNAEIISKEPLGRRLMAGHLVLVQAVGVRIPAPQLILIQKKYYE